MGRRCKTKDVLEVLEELTSLYPTPVFIRSDNGPKFNGYAESSRLRPRPQTVVQDPWHHHGLHRARLTVADAQGLADRWGWEYNTLRPHSALQGRTPLEAAQEAAA